MIREYIIQIANNLNRTYPGILPKDKVERAVEMFENSGKSYEQIVTEINSLRDQMVRNYQNRENKRSEIYYYSNAAEDERESRTFAQIKEVQLKVQELLDQYGLKIFIAGGSVPYLLTNEDSGRLHDDIDTICMVEDIDKLRQVFISAGLYNPKWDSKIFSPDGIDYGFEMKIDGVPFGIFPFIYDEKSKTITQYSTDPYNQTCKTKTIPVEEITDYIMTYRGRNGKDYNTMSLEYIKLTKDNARRPKDMADSKKIEEIGLLRQDVLNRIQMYTEYINTDENAMSENNKEKAK